MKISMYEKQVDQKQNFEMHVMKHKIIIYKNKNGYARLILSFRLNLYLRKLKLKLLNLKSFHNSGKCYAF